MAKPYVSVVIITYGHERFIEEAIQNVLSQECKFEVELIIANDNSPDETDKVINGIIKNHPNAARIKYHKHEKNLGIVPNFVFALQQAKGQFIALCEGDDYWTDPLKLQKQVAFFNEKPEMVFCFHSANRFVQNTGKVFPYIGLENFKNKELIPQKDLFKRMGGTYPTASAMFRREILDNLPSYFHIFGVGDTPLFLLAISKGKIGYLQDSMCIYRTTETNWSSENDVFSNKYNNYQKKIIAYDAFNEFTNKKFNRELKQTFSHLTYQVVFAYFIEEKKLVKKISFFFRYQKRMITTQKAY
jgi:glycosyltransferase involved in cell wall biosynthesis